MHTNRTNALIFSNLSIITKGNKKRADKITFSTFRKKTMLRLSMEIAPRLQKLLLFAYLCFTGQQKEKQPMQNQESRAMNLMFIARLIILYVIQVIKRITEYGNEPEDGTKLAQGDHSAWPVQSGGACVQRQLQPYHTHVRATFQPSPNLPNHLHLP